MLRALEHFYLLIMFNEFSLVQRSLHATLYLYYLIMKAFFNTEFLWLSFCILFGYKSACIGRSVVIYSFPFLLLEV